MGGWIGWWVGWVHESVGWLVCGLRAWVGRVVGVWVGCLGRSDG